MMIEFGATIAIAVVAAIHVWFLVLEMFLWRTPFGRKTFGTAPEFAEQAAALAANQGLYNGFLAAGLVWSRLAGPPLARPLAVFFLACVVVAGVYGAYSVSRRIVFIQAFPALVALLLVFLAR